MKDNRLLILIVDNLGDAADRVFFLLQSWGFEVRDCSESLPVDPIGTSRAVLVDAQMPQKDGLVLADRLGKSGLANTVIVPASGVAGKPYRVETCEAGFKLFPVNPADLDFLYKKRTRLVAQPVSRLDTKTQERVPSWSAHP